MVVWPAVSQMSEYSETNSVTCFGNSEDKQILRLRMDAGSGLYEYRFPSTELRGNF
jgi:hypothetical protein